MLGNSTQIFDNSTDIDSSSHPDAGSILIDYLFDLSRLIAKIAPPIILVFGTFGNVMILALFGRQKPASSLSLYFTVLAASDLCLLYVGMFPSWVNHLTRFDLKLQHVLSCKLVTYLYYVFGLLSVWILVAMTTQRAASVVWPHKVNLLCTLRRSLIYVIIILVVICLITSHILYGITIVVWWDGSLVCRNINNAEYSDFLDDIWPWIDAMIYAIFPTVILIVSNSILVWKVSDSVRKARATLASGQSDQLGSRTKKVSSMTVTLIVVSVTFFVLSTPLSMYFIIVPQVLPNRGQNQLTVEILALVRYCLNAMWYSNSAINFYLYCLTGTKFRSEVRKIFCREKKTMSSSTHMSEISTNGKIS